MKDIVNFINEAIDKALSGFCIIDMSDKSLVSKWGTGDLMKCINEIQKLIKENKDKEYWIVAEYNEIYDLEDTGNYRVLSSREYAERDTDFGINPKFKEYLS
jgi:hypothetical protein